MKKTRIWRCGIAAVLAVTLIVTQTAAVSAEIEPGFRKSEVVLISEQNTEAPEGFAAVSTGPSVSPSLEGFDWEDGGIHGQAVRFNGAGEYVEYTNPDYCSGELSIVGWVNWEGSASRDPAREYNQQLFTVMRDNDNYYTVTLRYRSPDPMKEDEDGTAYYIDGVYLEYKIDGSAGKHVTAYDLTTDGIDYAIPKNEWTHIAMTISKHAIKLYINGRHWFEEPLEDACYTLDAKKVVVGGWVDVNDPSFNGLLDDVALFRGILRDEIIAYMAQGASLDFYPPEAKEPTPTGTQTTTAGGEVSSVDDGGDTFKDVDNSSAFSDIQIPTFAWFVVGGLVLLMIVGTIALNRHEAKRKKEEQT